MCSSLLWLYPFLQTLSLGCSQVNLLMNWMSCHKSAIEFDLFAGHSPICVGCVMILMYFKSTTRTVN